MLIQDEMALQREIDRAGQWIDSLETEESKQAIADRLLELAALLFHSPAEFQTDYLRWIAKSVLRMPMLVLASATVDDNLGSDKEAGLRIDMTAYCRSFVAPGLGPIIEKLRSTADAFEKILRETTLSARTLTIYDSDQKPAGQT